MNCSRLYIIFTLLALLLAAGQAAWATVTGTGTENDPFVVYSWADLKAKMAVGGYIQLGANVTDPDGTGASYLEVPAGVSVTLDLNGHTIDRNMTESQVGGYVIKLDGKSNSHASLTIRDSSNPSTGKITGGFDGTDSGGSAAGGINVQYGDLTLEGGGITGNQCTLGGGGGVRLAGGTFTMTGGSITGNGVNTLENGAASAGGGIYGVSGDIYLRGGSITGNLCHGSSSYACSGIAHNYASGAAQLHLSGTFTLSDYLHGNREFIYLDGPINPTAPIAIDLYSGYNTQLTKNWSTHMGTANPEGYFTLVANSESAGKVLAVIDDNLYIGTPEALYWHADANHDGSSEEKAYIITTTEGLDLLAKQVNGTDGYTNNTFKGKFFKLGADIAYSTSNLAEDESNYTPIGTHVLKNNHWQLMMFRGTFDGAGHTISGIRIYKIGDTKGNQYLGLFGNNEGIVKNVTTSDAVISGHSVVGGIAGENQGLICGCTSAATVKGRYDVGGVAGYNSSTIENCLAIGATITATNNRGGAIVGRNWQYDGKYLGILSHNYYSGCTLTIGGGQPATSGIGCGNQANGTLTPTDLPSMTVKDVTYTDCAVPVPSSSSITLVQGTKDNITAWWGTFHHSALRYTLPEGAVAYTMDSSHQLYRLGPDGHTIPAGVAVVIIADKETIALTPDTSTSTATFTDHAPGGNILKGVDTPTAATGTPYVLGVVEGKLGFYEYKGGPVPANKAYYVQ
jgi:hypothetical protein